MGVKYPFSGYDKVSSTKEAIDICERWFEYQQKQIDNSALRLKSLQLQKEGTKESMREASRIDSKLRLESSVVYDAGKLVHAVDWMVKLCRGLVVVEEKYSKKSKWNPIHWVKNLDKAKEIVGYKEEQNPLRKYRMVE